MDPSSYITVWVLQAGPRSDFYLRSLWTWGELLHNFPFRNIQTMNNSLRAAMLARQRDTVLPLMFLVSFFFFLYHLRKGLERFNYHTRVQVRSKDPDEGHGRPWSHHLFQDGYQESSKSDRKRVPITFWSLAGAAKKVEGGSICGEGKKISHIYIYP